MDAEAAVPERSYLPTRAGAVFFLACPVRAGCPPPSKGTIIEPTQLGEFRDADQVMSKAPKLDRNDRGEVVVEEKLQPKSL